MKQTTEKNREYKRRYKEKHPERFKEQRKIRGKRYREKNRNNKGSAYYVSYRWHLYRIDARRREIFFDLSKEYFGTLLSRRCHYCGEGDDAYTQIGVDRKDPRLGYTLDNCVPCCWDCNYMKGTKEYAAFLKKILQMSRIILK